MGGRVNTGRGTANSPLLTSRRVNLRPSPGLQDMKELMKKTTGSGCGNKFGIMLLPVYYHKNDSDPFRYFKRPKVMIDRKKSSLEAFLAYQIGNFIMKFFGAKEFVAKATPLPGEDENMDMSDVRSFISDDV
ncbi:O-acyltransferase WSD1-like protein [Tanacetum coccineum]